jgi:hypothetical protein
MKKYIVLTNEGYTFSPKDSEINNLQVLGFIESKNKEEAKEKFFINNEWVLETGFDKNNMIIYELR